MGDHKRFTHEELKALVAPYNDLPARRIIHKASGDHYTITGVHLRESDLTVEVTYRHVRKGNPAFSRPVSEMLDGRFDFGDYRPNVGESA